MKITAPAKDRSHYRALAKASMTECKLEERAPYGHRKMVVLTSRRRARGAV